MLSRGSATRRSFRRARDLEQGGHAWIRRRRAARRRGPGGIQWVPTTCATGSASPAEYGETSPTASARPRFVSWQTPTIGALPASSRRIPTRWPCSRSARGRLAQQGDPRCRSGFAVNDARRLRRPSCTGADRRARCRGRAQGSGRGRPTSPADRGPLRRRFRPAGQAPGATESLPVEDDRRPPRSPRCARRDRNEPALDAQTSRWRRRPSARGSRSPITVTSGCAGPGRAGRVRARRRGDSIARREISHDWSPGICRIPLQRYPGAAGTSIQCPDFAGTINPRLGWPGICSGRIALSFPRCSARVTRTDRLLFFLRSRNR